MTFRDDFQWLRETIHVATGVKFCKVEIEEALAPFHVVFGEGDRIELVLSYLSVVNRDTSAVAILAIEHQGKLRQASEPRCPSRCDSMVCCHASGHDLHHEEAPHGNRVGWVEDDAGGEPIKFAICALDSPALIADVIAASCRARIASRTPKMVVAAVMTEMTKRAFRQLQEAVRPSAESPVIIAAPIDSAAPLYTITRTCRGCSSPPTVGDFCAYCATRHGPIDEATKTLHTERFTVSVEARARVAKADARARRVPTKSERELAKGHPSTWPSQDGEP